MTRIALSRNSSNEAPTGLDHSSPYTSTSAAPLGTQNLAGCTQSSSNPGAFRIDVDTRTTSTADKGSRRSENTPTQRFTNCSAGDGVDQINGPVFEFHRPYNKGDPPLNLSHRIYIFDNCTKSGSGMMVNGPHVTFHGKAQGDTIPFVAGNWTHCQVTSEHASSSQVNGGRYVWK